MYRLKQFFTNRSILVVVISLISVHFIYLNDSPSSPQDTLGYKLLSIKKGDRCIICDIPLKEGSGLALLIKGRRVTIDLNHFQEFITNQVKYFAKVEPQGALFQESAVLPHAIQYGWFIVGMWIFTALISAAICCNVAMRKGLRASLWFFRGLLFHFIGLLWVINKKGTAKAQPLPILGKIPLTSQPVKCPKCQALNHPAASKCSKCHSELTPLQESEVNRV
jgi:hypothetical protein